MDPEGCNILDWCQRIFEKQGDNRFIRYLIANTPNFDRYVEAHERRQLGRLQPPAEASI